MSVPIAVLLGVPIIIRDGSVSIVVVRVVMVMTMMVGRVAAVVAAVVGVGFVLFNSPPLASGVIVSIILHLDQACIQWSNMAIILAASTDSRVLWPGLESFGTSTLGTVALAVVLR